MISLIWLLILMVVGAGLFGFAMERLEAIPALLFFLAVFVCFGLFDVKFLFSRHNINLNTGFFFLEMSTIFFFTVAVKYVLEERNKKFVKTAFSRYVSPVVVDSILKDPSKLQIGGERKNLTILFSDIRGFTSFSEKMDAKSLAAFLNDYLGIMTDIVFKFQGTLDKYIGDAVMAFWGAPLDQPKHASLASQASVEMMKALAANHDRFKNQYGVDVKIGVGVNTGNVSVGNMGSTTNFEYTVIGDHVNLASRLEGLTKEYRASIVTSRFTFDGIAQVGETPPLHRTLDFVKVKGKKNAVELIQIFDQDYPREGMDFFEQGRQLYLKKQWDQAIGKFKAASEIVSKSKGVADGPSEIFIERCQAFKENPPASDWDGSWEMDHK